MYSLSFMMYTLKTEEMSDRSQLDGAGLQVGLAVLYKRYFCQVSQQKVVLCNS